MFSFDNEKEEYDLAFAIETEQYLLTRRNIDLLKWYCWNFQALSHLEVTYKSVS